MVGKSSVASSASSSSPIDGCAGHDSECAASVVLQVQEKLRLVAVAREMKLLDAAVSHEHAISVVVAAGIFGG